MIKSKKSMSILLSALLLISCNLVVLAAEKQESTINDKSPAVVIEDTAKEIPFEIIQKIIRENPDAGQITIIDYGEAQKESRDIQPRLVRGYSEVKKTYRVFNSTIDDLFVTSVAKCKTKKLGVAWSHTVSCSITGGIDEVSLGITGNVTKTYSEEDVFQGPPENSNYNSREFRVKFYVNKGTYTALAHDDLPGFVAKIPISGDFIEPAKYVAYSIDKTVNAR